MNKSATSTARTPSRFTHLCRRAVLLSILVSCPSTLPAIAQEGEPNSKATSPIASTETNLRISDRPPAVYMKDILDQLQPQMFYELLTSHLLPATPDSPLWRDDFEAFLDWRQEAIWQAIKHVTGAVEAADLLSDEVPA